MSFSLVQLTHFTEAARAGSMTVAAARLFVSQPALSASISQLEKELGVTLLERIPRRGVRLTRAGRKFYEDSVMLLDRAQAMSEAARRDSGALGGRLRIGIYQPIAGFHAPLLLEGFTQRHPEVSVELIEADQDELSRLVSGRSVDVAVSYAHVPFTGLHTEVLQEIRPHAVVPATHHLASHPGPVSLAELAADPLILLDIPHTGSYYLGLFRAAGLEPAVRFRVSGYETVRGLVARGFGVSVLNQRVRHGRTLSGESVHALTLADDPAPLPIEFVCLPDMLEDPHVIAFRDVCRRLLVPR